MGDWMTLREVGDEYVFRVLARSGGNLSLAARRLGIYRSTLKRRLSKIGHPSRAAGELLGATDRDHGTVDRCATR